MSSSGNGGLGSVNAEQLVAPVVAGSSIGLLPSFENRNPRLYRSVAVVPTVTLRWIVTLSPALQDVGSAPAKSGSRVMLMSFVSLAVHPVAPRV